jgi:hypothetical protein
MDQVSEVITVGVGLLGTFAVHVLVKKADSLHTKRWFPWVAAAAQMIIPLLPHTSPVTTAAGLATTGAALWAYRRQPDKVTDALAQ